MFETCGICAAQARWAVALCALVPLLAACSGSGGARPAATQTQSAPGPSPAAAAPAYMRHGADRDNDGDRNNDDFGVLGYGRPAGPADRSASDTLIRRYFAAAANGDGASGCRLLAPAIAESVGEAREQGQRRRPCAVALSALFRSHQSELALKRATLRIVAVRVSGAHALAVLAFPTIPEVRQLVERRVGGAWRLVTVLDGILE